MRIYGLLPLVLPELELRCGAGSPNHDCAWQGRGGTGVAMYGSQPTTTVQIKPATYNLRTLEPVATYNLRNPHIISQRSPKTAFLSVSGCRSDAHVCESVRWREISTGSAQSQRTRSAL